MVAPTGIEPATRTASEYKVPEKTVNWFERRRAFVFDQRYTMTNDKSNEEPLAPKDEPGLWFQCNFCISRGA